MLQDLAERKRKEQLAAIDDAIKAIEVVVAVVEEAKLPEVSMHEELLHDDPVHEEPISLESFQEDRIAQEPVPKEPKPTDEPEEPKFQIESSSDEDSSSSIEELKKINYGKKEVDVEEVSHNMELMDVHTKMLMSLKKKLEASSKAPISEEALLEKLLQLLDDQPQDRRPSSDYLPSESLIQSPTSFDIKLLPTSSVVEDVQISGHYEPYKSDFFSTQKKNG